MTEYKELIYDVVTGETTERDLTKKEIDAIKARQAEMDAEDAIRLEQQAAKQAVLDKLGLSVEEVAALLG